MRRKLYIFTTLLIGTLDIVINMAMNYFAKGIKPEGILRFIASGVFGKAAFTGTNTILFWGLFFHYLITAGIVIAFYIFSGTGLLKAINKYALALLIAIASWVVTNLIILPLSNAPKIPFSFSRFLVELVILFVAIGLPLAFIENKRYSER